METVIGEADGTVTIALTHDELHIIGDPLNDAIRVCDFMNMPVPSDVCAAVAKINMAHDAIKLQEENDE